MRELYATELRAESATNAQARGLVEAWANRHIPAAVEGSGTTIELTETTAGSLILVLEQRGEPDPTVRWRSSVALGPPDATALATVRIAIGAAGPAIVAPAVYEFGTPAIVRTLIRELDVVDGTIPCAADLQAEIGPSDIPALRSELERDRRLPVVVVSRDQDRGAAFVDARELTKELAGLAHVRLLSSARSSWELTDSIGQPLSVWGGAARVYFPGFASTDDPRRHRIIFADRMGPQSVGQLRSWLGALSAASTPEHPALAEQRDDRAATIAAALATDDADELYELIKVAEGEAEAERITSAELKERVAVLERELAERESELEQVRSNFADVTAAQATGTSGDAHESWAPSSVADAMDAVEELASSRFYLPRVRVSSSAIRSGRGFASYGKPGELVRAVHAVLEAGALYHDNTMGEPPADFFGRRGFGYGARPTPHLKVDESTSPDQCLRIYWVDDEDERTWTITSIGSHV